MNFSLVVCTYMRPNALLNLLNSVNSQTLYPSEIIIVDGSYDDSTQKLNLSTKFKGLKYYLVKEEDRGLTKQRNLGIGKVSKDIDIVCFLDDDIILENFYFSELIETYKIKEDAIGVGGYITNEVEWEPATEKSSNNKYYIDGFERVEGSRFLLRNKLGLVTNDKPGVMPSYSHGRSIGYLPPSGKVYPVEYFMGGVASYRKEVFKKIHFSEYFEGYGLYEDLDFCLRLSSHGNLYVNTRAKLSHYHEPSGRPNQYHYGKMVIRNGWYVWRVKFKSPNLVSIIKWNATALLLTLIRSTNIFTSTKKIEALTETIGRVLGWFSLLFNKPKVLRKP